MNSLIETKRRLESIISTIKHERDNNRYSVYNREYDYGTFNAYSNAIDILDTELILIQKEIDKKTQDLKDSDKFDPEDYDIVYVE